MIEFACHTWTFNDLTVPEALGTIARLGFRYADIGFAALECRFISGPGPYERLDPLVAAMQFASRSPA